jgi:hypothetical protein
MFNTIRIVDRVIPLWELLVLAFALFAIVLVLVLWWAFGYNLIVVPEQVPAAVKPAALALSLL